MIEDEACCIGSEFGRFRCGSVVAHLPVNLWCWSKQAATDRVPRTLCYILLADPHLGTVRTR
jgi:hypothetical protein